MLGNFACIVFFCASILIKQFSYNPFKDKMRVSNNFESDQAQHFAGLGLDPNGLL